MYDDAPAGIKWLTEVLGLTAEISPLIQMPDGRRDFAEHFGVAPRHCVRLQPAYTGFYDNPSTWSKMGIASIALVAEDAKSVTEHYERARSAGADIVRALHVARTPAFPDGSTQFDVRDPEGNHWLRG